MTGIPAALDTDAEDVVWALQTADALWKRNERVDAIVWLRRAAQAAGDAEDDDRALALARDAAELSEWLAHAAPPPSVSPAPTSNAPPSGGEPPTSATPSAIDDLLASASHVDHEATLRDGEMEAPPQRMATEPLGFPDAAPPPRPVITSAPPPPKPVVASAPPPPPPHRSVPPSPSRHDGGSIPPRSGEVPTAAEAHAGMLDPWAEEERRSRLPASPPAATPPPPPPPPPVRASPPPPAPPPPAPPPPIAAEPPRPPPPPSFDDEDEEVVTSARMPVAAPVAPPVEAPAASPPPAAAAAPAPAPPRPVPGMRKPPPLPAKKPPLPPQAKKPPPPEAAKPPAPPPAPAPAEEPATPVAPDEAPTPIAPPVAAEPELDLAPIEAFADLPDDARAAFARAASIRTLAKDEEVSGFAIALVLDGSVDVSSPIVDAPAERLDAGAVMRARGTIEPALPVRLLGATPRAKVAIWRDDAVEEALRTCPWVEDDLRAAGDRLQALVGITMGPLGERLDAALRRSVTSKLEMRALAAREVVANEGEPVPGLIVVAAGEVEIVHNDRVESTIGPGEFLFPSQVLGAQKAPATARAAEGGALVLAGDRGVAQELMVTCPPLLEIFAGM